MAPQKKVLPGRAPEATSLPSPLFSRAHAQLIAVGVYTLVAALAGFAAACCRSVRAATLFLLLQCANAAAALLVLAGAWMAGAVSVSMVAANVPGIILIIYLVVCVNSYRLLLREEASGAPRASGMERLPGSAGVFEDDDEEEEEGDAGGSGGAYRDKAPAAEKAAAAAAGGGGGSGRRSSQHPSVAVIHEDDEGDDDDEEGDLGVPARTRRV